MTGFIGLENRAGSDVDQVELPRHPAQPDVELGQLAGAGPPGDAGRRHHPQPRR